MLHGRFWSMVVNTWIMVDGRMKTAKHPLLRDAVLIDIIPD
jgi:hypothetical protein